MKNIIIIALLGVLSTACYDDYRLDYEYTTVAFSGADGGSNMEGVLFRTAVMGEGMELDIGIYLAGVLENRQERVVAYEIDESLLAGTDFELLPESYYTLSNTENFVIPEGTVLGKVTVTLDSSDFAADPLAIGHHYALPIVLIGAESVDSVSAAASSKIVVIRYMNDMAGSYDQTLTYKTYDASGAEIGGNSLQNVLTTQTTGPHSILTNGMVFLGADFTMEIMAEGGAVGLTYVPNPLVDNSPKNVAREDAEVAVSTNFISPWENLAGLNQGGEPTSSMDKAGAGNMAYGNWGSPADVEEFWVEYEWPTNVYQFNLAQVYWWTDGGGILMPDFARIEYWDVETETWEHAADVGVQPDQYNDAEVSFTTNKVRLYFGDTDGDPFSGQGILEWRAWGVPVPTQPEQAAVERVTLLSEQANSYDPETGLLHLNYRIDYATQDYYTEVSTEMVWRNRIRDGVNEWRR